MVDLIYDFLARLRTIHIIVLKSNVTKFEKKRPIFFLKRVFYNFSYCNLLRTAAFNLAKGRVISYGLVWNRCARRALKVVAMVVAKRRQCCLGYLCSARSDLSVLRYAALVPHQKEPGFVLIA